MLSPVRAQHNTGLNTFQEPNSKAAIVGRVAQRIEVPTSFDRETVQQLIDTVEQGRNATILKTGYFYRRGKPELPVLEGFELLKAALQKEPEGTKRWFILQNVRGWAGFQNADIPVAESFEAYDSMFGAAEQAHKVGALYRLQQSILDYVFAVQGRFSPVGLRTNENVKNTLLNAWSAYVTYLTANSTERNNPLRVPEPRWAEVITLATLQSDFAPRIEQDLAKGDVPKTYELLTAAAAAFHYSNPERAVMLLQQAKPLLPHEDSKEVKRFYEQWINALLARVQTGASFGLDAATHNAAITGEAVKVQQDYVRLTGKGYTELLKLQIRNADQPGLSATVNELARTSAQAGEVEINEVAEVLISLWKKDRDQNAYAAGLADTLLAGYISSERKRTVEQELKARVQLGHVYMEQKRMEDARRIISVDHLNLQPADSNPRLRSYISQLQQMSQVLSRMEQSRPKAG